MITNELVKKVHQWLGPEGRDFFKGIKENNEDLATAVWMENGIPHPVHFREGMQVRNFLRKTGLCDNWTDHDLDNNWGTVIEQALEGNPT